MRRPRRSPAEWRQPSESAPSSGARVSLKSSLAVHDGSLAARHLQPAIERLHGLLIGEQLFDIATAGLEALRRRHFIVVRPHRFLGYLRLRAKTQIGVAQ